MGQSDSTGRKVIVITDGQKINNDFIAQILARHITGGDYAGYLQRLAKQEQESKKAV